MSYSELIQIVTHNSFSKFPIAFINLFLLFLWSSLQHLPGYIFIKKRKLIDFTVTVHLLVGMLKGILSFKIKNMEYYRTDDGQIQADLALRSGKILYQYSNLLTSHEKYEVSLSLIILQNLLTNCVELFNSMTRTEKKSNPLHKRLSDEDPYSLSSCVVKNTFRESDISMVTVLRHMRNALSHPTKIKLNDGLVSTGYTTEGKTSSIEKVIFVTSPDVKFSKSDFSVFKEYPDIDSAEKILQSGDFPKEVTIGQSNENKYAFYLNGDAFYRIFQIELTPDQIFDLTMALCSFLSHPLNQNWDGESFSLKSFAA